MTKLIKLNGGHRTSNRTIPLSTNAAFHHSVSKIEWFETEKGYYGLNIFSTCPRPYYFARLTGPSLVATQRMMHYNYSQGERRKFEDVIYREGANSMQYLRSVSFSLIEKNTMLLSVLEFFPVHHAGFYFLEVLHISCNSTDESLVTDCLPNSLDFLTLNEAFHIELGASSKKLSSPIRWIRQKDKLTLKKGITTRIQLGNASHSNIWFDKYNMTILDLVQYPHGNNCSICLIGASHSRKMKQAMNMLFETKQRSCHAFHFDVKFPQSYMKSVSKINGKIKKHKCTDVIVAIGQWALSWKNGNHFQSSQDFKRHMNNIVDSFIVNHPDRRLTLRTLHYHPLSDIILTCKPTDWRSPMLVDTYNEIIMQIEESHPGFQASNNLNLIDTSEVVRPIWDTPDDWSHYGMKAGIPEAIYLLNHIWSPKEVLHQEIGFTKNDTFYGFTLGVTIGVVVCILLVMVYLVVKKEAQMKRKTAYKGLPAVSFE